MEFEAIIGLEIHVEMNTVSKMFSTGPVTFGKEPNTQVNVNDMAFLGTMPSLNKQAVVHAIRLSNALNMEIDKTIMFERKNYFYSDLPKGYQITQQYRPIGKNGYLNIKIGKDEKQIGIEKLHMEEDTCKQIHLKDCSLLDYNRAGIPLIEIVSKPNMRSGEEAAKYVEKMRSIVSFLGVSNGKMEEGSMRCDVNISLKEKGTAKLGAKVEIKNLNSLANIQKAVEYEIARQSSILKKGEMVQQDTRRFDETSQTTVQMRFKTESEDYKYFTEPNIPPIRLTDEFVEDAIRTSPELAESRQKRYEKLGLNEYDSSLLLTSKEKSDYFEKVGETGANPKLAANWINGDVQSYLNKNNISINEFNISPNHLGALIKLIESNVISNKQARAMFEKMLEKDEDPIRLVDELDFNQISDENKLLTLINELLDQNPQLIMEYKSGKDRVLGFFMAQIMKKTQGKANPTLTNKLLIQEINRR